MIFDLSFSRGGRYLAATLGGGNGIRVFDMQNNLEVFQDRDYGNDSYGSDFDVNDRLVTSSYDGYIRLYEPHEHSFRLITKTKMQKGKRPFGVAFSPDGRLIAVGYDNSPAIEVLSGKDLSLVFSPDAPGTSAEDNVLSVAWSADGRWLYAGGKYDEGAIHPVFRWGQGGVSEWCLRNQRWVPSWTWWLCPGAACLLEHPPRGLHYLMMKEKWPGQSRRRVWIIVIDHWLCPKTVKTLPFISGHLIMESGIPARLRYPLRQEPLPWIRSIRRSLIIVVQTPRHYP
ncbi:MAG: hypothetical protein GKR95_21385 [Gammaproteobacteria bacterium]|nr:hypothetical protein [Gammaproteobacteria bacterium]